MDPACSPPSQACLILRVLCALYGKNPAARACRAGGSGLAGVAQPPTAIHGAAGVCGSRRRRDRRCHWKTRPIACWGLRYTVTRISSTPSPSTSERRSYRPTCPAWWGYATPRRMVRCCYAATLLTRRQRTRPSRTHIGGCSPKPPLTVAGSSGSALGAVRGAALAGLWAALRRRAGATDRRPASRAGATGGPAAGSRGTARDLPRRGHRGTGQHARCRGRGGRTHPSSLLPASPVRHAMRSCGPAWIRRSGPTGIPT